MLPLELKTLAVYGGFRWIYVLLLGYLKGGTFYKSPMYTFRTSYNLDIIPIELQPDFPIHSNREGSTSDL